MIVRLIRWWWSWMERKGPSYLWQCRAYFRDRTGRRVCQRCRGHLGPHRDITGRPFTDTDILWFYGGRADV